MSQVTNQPSDLAAVIRAIRKRCGKTQVEFAKNLKVSHAAVSRYESGHISPGHNPLFSLYQLADGHEKRVIGDALRDVLGLKEVPSDREIQQGADTSAKAFGDLEEIAGQTRGTRAHRFATEAMRIAKEASKTPDDYPPESLIEILALFWEHRDEPEALHLFEDTVGYLNFSLRKGLNIN